MQDRFWDRTYRLARRLGLSSVDAEDCAAEARLRGLLQQQNPIAVAGVARNTVRSVLRQRSRELCFTQLLPDGEPPAAFADIPTSYCNPEAIVINTSPLKSLYAAIERLPEPTRSIFVAVVVDGETYASVAKRHGRSVGSVQQIVHRVRERLRSELEPECIQSNTKKIVSRP